MSPTGSRVYVAQFSIWRFCNTNLNAEDDAPKVPEPGSLWACIAYLVYIVTVGAISTKGCYIALFNGVVISISLMTLLGLIDDMVPTSYFTKVTSPVFASIPVFMAPNNYTLPSIPAFNSSLLRFEFLFSCAYYVVCVLLTIFFVNAINIHAGINGLEVGQSVIIALSLLVHNCIEIAKSTTLPDAKAAMEMLERHMMSLRFTLPFLSVNAGLLCYNWYPASTQRFDGAVDDGSGILLFSDQHLDSGPNNGGSIEHIAGDLSGAQCGSDLTPDGDCIPSAIDMDQSHHKSLSTSSLNKKEHNDINGEDTTVDARQCTLGYNSAVDAEINGPYTEPRKYTSSRNDMLYSQLLRLVNSTRPSLEKENCGLFNTLEAFVSDMNWDVWKRIIKSSQATNDRRSFVDRYQTLESDMKQCLSDLTSRCKDGLKTKINEGRTALRALTKSLGIHASHDTRELNLMIDQLVDEYQDVEQDHRWSVMRSVTRWMQYKLVGTIDSILPLNPASVILYTVRAARDVFNWIRSWLQPKSTFVDSFTESSLYKYYEMRKAYIHVPRIWTNECRPLSPPHSGSWRLTLLGTGARKPTQTRLTSTILFGRTDESLWLFDCGEGAFTRVWEAGYAVSRVKKIFITHLHGDHCFGIFSFLGISPTSEPIEIYGPSGTARFIADVLTASSRSHALRQFVVNELVKPQHGQKAQPDQGEFEKMFKVNFIQPDSKMHYVVYEDDTCVVKAAPLVHTINTVGYVVEEKPSDPSDSRNHRVLSSSHSESHQKPLGGPSYTKDHLRKFVVCQDCSDSRLLQPLAMDADVVIHESTLNPPTNGGSELLLRLTRHAKNGQITRTLLRRIDEVMQMEEMKFQLYHSTIENIRYQYYRKLQFLRDNMQRYEALEAEWIQLVESSGDQLIPASSSSGDNDTSLSTSWRILVKRLTGALKLYSATQAMVKVVTKLENLLALMTELRKTCSEGGGMPTSRAMQHNLRAIVTQILEEEGFKVDYRPADPESSTKLSRGIDRIAPLIFNYWNDVLDSGAPQRENGIYGREEWEQLYNSYAHMNGHSTCLQAGDFAARTRARKLILTHFSQNTPDGVDRETVLTMCRIAHSALRGYHRRRSGHDYAPITIGAAWDMFSITL
ncbi:N-acetylglucosamine-1-phosphate transferase [Babesia ovis]|uniref:N-acetylglucosamine-1-phosphate transferase n=1 Tax=Babesia ovis TaxID=5869 RepID=A0A9W5TCD1_BABOV|nr:N-acetylglucosamine-1-phosphate transferase [Babesia ovis]